MTTEQIKLLHLKLNTAARKYESANYSLEAALNEFIEFSFFIQHHQSDGLVIVNSDTYENAPLDKCILIIINDGKLTHEMYKTLLI